MRSATVGKGAVVEESDSSLAIAAADGDHEAFGELYRRHAPAAWGVAQSVVRNPDDAADAVAEAFTKVFRALPTMSGDAGRLPSRAYLLSATRHAAIDVVRRRARVANADNLDEWDDHGPVDGARGPDDAVVAGEDHRQVIEAFAQLPERWRTVLWLIEVEQLSTSEAGQVLGVSPNNAAQLAGRARSRLRECYLQAQVPSTLAPGCREPVTLLGSYLAGTATRRRRMRVGDHLAGCGACRGRVSQLEDLGLSLRGGFLPLPLLVHERARRAWAGLPHGRANRRLAEPLAAPLPKPPAQLLDAVVTHPAAAWTRAADLVAPFVHHLSAAPPAVARLVAGVSVGVLAAGMAVVGPLGRDETPSGPAAVPSHPYAYTSGAGVPLAPLATGVTSPGPGPGFTAGPAGDPLGGPGPSAPAAPAPDAPGAGAPTGQSAPSPRPSVGSVLPAVADIVGVRAPLETVVAAVPLPSPSAVLPIPPGPLPVALPVASPAAQNQLPAVVDSVPAAVPALVAPVGDVVSGVKQGVAGGVTETPAAQVPLLASLPLPPL